MSYERPTDEEMARDLLLQMMKDFSEDCWCAGWLIELEYILWDAVSRGHAKAGECKIDERDLARMKYLHELSGGWWVFPEGEKSVRFIPAEVWMQMLREHDRKQSTKLPGPTD